MLRWQELTSETIKQLINFGVKAEEISIENLNYPFLWVEEIIKNFHFTVCMDIGHLIVYGVDIKKFYHSHSDKISIIHIHGVENGRDHLSLKMFPEERAGEIIEILKKYSKVVSIEVFSYDDLMTSLKFFEKCWNKFDGVVKSPHSVTPAKAGVQKLLK